GAHIRALERVLILLDNHSSNIARAKSLVLPQRLDTRKEKDRIDKTQLRFSFLLFSSIDQNDYFRSLGGKSVSRLSQILTASPLHPNQKPSKRDLFKSSCSPMRQRALGFQR